MINKILISILLLSLTFISCSSSESGNTISFTDTGWILRSLNDKKIIIPESGKEISVSFNSSGNKLNGFAGCNNFFGTYKKNNNLLTIGQLASTEMFCQSMMETETEFLKAMQKTVKYKISGDYLQLYDSVKMFAKFEAIGNKAVKEK
ncbi:MAG: META domain-containing protein [Ignavibacteria bacterium]|nr:META domain-containing protein [Ignavibacteria bacterium]